MFTFLRCIVLDNYLNTTAAYCKLHLSNLEIIKITKKANLIHHDPINLRGEDDFKLIPAS